LHFFRRLASRALQPTLSLHRARCPLDTDDVPLSFTPRGFPPNPAIRITYGFLSSVSFPAQSSGGSFGLCQTPSLRADLAHRREFTAGLGHLRWDPPWADALLPVFIPPRFLTAQPHPLPWRQTNFFPFLQVLSLFLKSYDFPPSPRPGQPSFLISNGPRRPKS